MKKCFFMICLFMTLSLSVEAQRGCCSWHGGVSHCSENGRYVCNDGTYSPSCTCTPAITYKYGCTNSNAINYDSNANRDDGSCILKVFGCTNLEAINYNSSANTADGSCQFSSDEVIEEVIPFETVTIDGTENGIQQEGKNGKREITTRIIKDESGNIVSSSVIDSKVIEESVNQIVMVGTVFEEEDKVDDVATSSDDDSGTGGGIFGLVVITTIGYVVAKKMKLF